MELWIPITIAAAFVQNVRFMLQKHLRAGGLSTAGATFSRFVFAVPIAAVIFGSLFWMRAGSAPIAGWRFATFAMTGGVAQILATLCVVALFAERSFSVGITFKKTEMVQTAIIGMVVLGEGISLGGLVAIGIGLFGVILLSDPPQRMMQDGWTARVFNRASGLGLASGALFGVSAVGYRGASLALVGGDFLLRAAATLAFVTLFQTLLMSIYLIAREPGQIRAVLVSWRVTGLVGLTGTVGSFCWFSAFTLQNAAYVKALGQIELVFTFMASYLVFGERSKGRELAGIALVVISIFVLVFGL